jgi:hypothetical protein
MATQSPACESRPGTPAACDGWSSPTGLVGHRSPAPARSKREPQGRATGIGADVVVPETAGSAGVRRRSKVSASGAVIASAF